MKSRRLSILFAFVLVFNAIFAGFAFAEAAPTQSKKLKVVALGDSITFAPNSFPYLIKADCIEVTKFGKSGATTDDLLNAITGDSTHFVQSVQAADVITVNIGSNNLLVDTGLKNLLDVIKNGGDKVAISAAVAAVKPVSASEKLNISSDVSEILLKVVANKQKNAPMVVYNYYNPIDPAQSLGDPELDAQIPALVQFVDGQLADVNNQLRLTANPHGADVVDAYSKFKGNESQYIIPGDIHPTPAGHEALASLADGVIAAQQAEPQPGCTGVCGENPVEVPEGCPQPDPTPTPEPPVENPTPNPTPAPTPEPPAENPAPQPVVQKPVVEKVKPAPIKKVEVVKATGSKLPNTATPVYNYLVLGLGLVFIGMVALGLQQHRQRRNGI